MLPTATVQMQMMGRRLGRVRSTPAAMVRRALHAGSPADARLVTLERQGRVGILRLNDPARLNQLSVAMATAIQDKVAEVNTNPQGLGAIVLTGEGRAFSTYGDVSSLEERLREAPSSNAAALKELAERCLSLRSLNVPLIAAINGPAAGCGLCLALFADIRIVAEQTQMGFVRHGLHPGMGCTHFLPLIVGDNAARYLMAEDQTIDGAKAMTLGLVSKVVASDDKVMQEAIKVANEMAAPSSRALRGVLRNLRLRQDKGVDMALAHEAEWYTHALFAAQQGPGGPASRAHASECP